MPLKKSDNVREAICRARNDNRGWTLAQIASYVGCSREYVRQVLRAAGLPTRGWSPWAPQPRGAARPPAKHNRYGGSHRLTSHVIGMISEMQVAADLAIRGYQVYRALADTAHCDLIAWDGHRCIRVEVRSASRAPSGQTSVSRVGDHDVLACVWPDGRVIYSPDDVICEEIAHRREND